MVRKAVRRAELPRRRPPPRGLTRLLRPATLGTAAALLVTATLTFGFVRAGHLKIPDAPVATDNRTLPVLPVISATFDGVPLDTYLRPPAVAPAQMDELLSSPVLHDPEFAKAVHWWVGYWTVSASKWFPGFLTRMWWRGSAVDSALAARGFPPSLRYLPLIESGYDPRVTSHTGAVGMWQLMPSTARGLGLSVTPVVDERRHVDSSTEAALRYLSALHSEFGSWFLTLAAYNTGPTRVRAILSRYAPDAPRTDSLFWALRDRFPLETREFVPKLFGAMWVASQPEAYGYEAPTFEPFVFDASAPTPTP
jgi:Transglycosylase SLT domain